MHIHLKPTIYHPVASNGIRSHSPINIDSADDRQDPATSHIPNAITKIDISRLNALRNPSKPSDILTDSTNQHSEDVIEPMQVDQAIERRTLRKKKENVPKHLKRGVNEKERDRFIKMVMRNP